MLTNLHIENVAVIERTDIDFSPGFNVLTGETGAGKSIIIDSLGSVLGERTSREIIRHGAEKAVITAVFFDSGAAAWCEENEIEYDDEIILQRRVTLDGKSSCRVNGVPVTVNQLHELGQLLLDIHGQNDGRQLLDESRHLMYLDGFAQVKAEKSAFTAAYKKFRQTQADISRLSIDERERELLAQSLRQRMDELGSAKLYLGEEAELLARRELLKNAGRLTEALDSAYESLYAGDVSAIGLTMDACDSAAFASSFSAELAEASRILTDARYMLEDAAERISDSRGLLDFSPEEYDELESRLALIKRLCKKYVRDESGLLDLIEESAEELQSLEFSEDKLILLQKQLEEDRCSALDLAKILSEKRKAAAEELSRRVESELKYLSMPSAKFEVEVEPVQNENGFDANGFDVVRFLLSANAGETPGRISKIASGGELSRIMLAMKSVFAQGDPVGSMVFDEIDAGVSGIAAQRVGEKMCRLAQSKQIICITHLPQIAALADAHFQITKQESEKRTYTNVDELDRRGRIEELARLHGGESVTEATLLSAQQQLEAAECFKRGT